MCTWSLTDTKWRISEKRSGQTVFADLNPWPLFPWMHESLEGESRSDRGWGREVKRHVGREGYRGVQRADEGEAFTGFNHSKTLNSYWVIKTFYESSCSNLQHYNSVPVQNKSAAALRVTFCASFTVQLQHYCATLEEQVVNIICNGGLICFKSLHYTVRSIFRCANICYI